MDADIVARAAAIKSEHKALGVVCFGYFRYRNARFGCAEVHQAIQCFGRAGMTRAREVAQAAGYRMVHSMTDCTFLQKPGVTRSEALRITKQIQDAVGVPMDLEGVFRWVVFLPSKTHSSSSQVGVPTRYYGVFADGTPKVRGLEVRRRSNPDFFDDVQSEMLEIFFEALDAAGFHARIPRALAVAQRAAQQIRARSVPAKRLAITAQTSRDVEDYKHNTGARTSLLKLRDRGHDLRPGQFVKYVVTRTDGAWEGRATPVEMLEDDGEFGSGATPQVTFYVRLLARSVETLLAPFGYTEESVFLWLMGKAHSPRASEPTPLPLAPPRPEYVR